MPLVNLYVDKRIYDKLVEYVREGYAPSLNELVLHAFLLLIKAVETCVEQGIKKSECFDKVIDFIIK